MDAFPEQRFTAILKNRSCVPLCHCLVDSGNLSPHVFLLCVNQEATEVGAAYIAKRRQARELRRSGPDIRYER